MNKKNQNIAADVQGLAATTTKEISLKEVKDGFNHVIESYYFSTADDISDSIRFGLECFNKDEIIDYLTYMEGLQDMSFNIEACDTENELRETLENSRFGDMLGVDLKTFELYLKDVLRFDEGVINKMLELMA